MNSAIHSSINGRSRADRAFRGTSRSSINWNSYQGSPICPATSRTRHLRMSAHPFKKRFPTATLKAPMCLGAGTFQSLSKHVRERQIVANKWLIGTHAEERSRALQPAHRSCPIDCSRSTTSRVFPSTDHQSRCLKEVSCTTCSCTMNDQ